MSVTPRGLSFTLAIVLLLLIAESLVIAAGHVFMLDKIRPSFEQYADFLPGQTQPAVGCWEIWDWERSYGVEFSCVYTGRDEIQVYGHRTTITGTSIAFSEARIGDVLALLGEPLPRPPWMSKRSRSQLFDWNGTRVYLYRSRNLFERERYLTFWRPLAL